MVVSLLERRRTRRPGSLRGFPQDSFEHRDQWWEFVAYCLPDDLQVHGVITVHDAIADTAHLPPRHLGIELLNVERYVPSGLAYHNQVPDDSFGSLWIS